MTTREAIKILIQSPMYFRLRVMDRLTLVKEFCQNYASMV